MGNGRVQLGQKAREQGRTRIRVRPMRHSPQVQNVRCPPNLSNKDKCYFNIIPDLSFYLRCQYKPSTVTNLVFKKKDFEYVVHRGFFCINLEFFNIALKYYLPCVLSFLVPS